MRLDIVFLLSFIDEQKVAVQIERPKDPLYNYSIYGGDRYYMHVVDELYVCTIL